MNHLLPPVYRLVIMLMLACIISRQVFAATDPGNGYPASKAVKVTDCPAISLWKVDFSLPSGATSVDTGAYRWTSSHTGANTSKFSVLNNEFRVSNSKAGKEGTWSSSAIDISGKTWVSISADVRSGVDANGRLESDTTRHSDYLRLYYKLDGGAEILFSNNNGSINNNSTTNTTVSTGPLNGTTLQIIIRSRASATDEYYYFDNVQLTTVPSINAFTTGTLTCTSNRVQLQGVSDIQGAVYSWTGPGGFSSSEQNTFAETAGIYTLLVTEPTIGCTVTTTTTVQQNLTAPGEISMSNPGSITCLTPNITLSGQSSSSDVTYLWTGPNGYTSASSTATVRHGGTYTLTATNQVNGCTTSKSTTVVENNAAPVITITNTGPLSCTNPTVTLSAATTAADAAYLWIGPEDFIDVAHTTSTIIPGLYIITVTDHSNGCIGTGYTEVTEDYSNCFARKATTTRSLTATTPVVDKFTYSAYPNPVTSSGVIEFASPDNTAVTVSIFNTSGVCEKVLYKGNAAAGQRYRLAIPAQLHAGAYYYIINAGSKTYSGRLVVVR